MFETKDNGSIFLQERHSSIRYSGIKKSKNTFQGKSFLLMEKNLLRGLDRFSWKITVDLNR